MTRRLACSVGPFLVLSACRGPGSSPVPPDVDTLIGCDACLAQGWFCGDAGDGRDGGCLATCDSAHRCGGVCCVLGSVCMSQSCQASDLRINDSTRPVMLSFAEKSITAGDCMLAAGCAATTGTQRLEKVGF